MHADGAMETNHDGARLMCSETMLSYPKVEQPNTW